MLACILKITPGNATPSLVPWTAAVFRGHQLAPLQQREEDSWLSVWHLKASSVTDAARSAATETSGGRNVQLQLLVNRQHATAAHPAGSVQLPNMSDGSQVSEQTKTVHTGNKCLKKDKKTEFKHMAPTIFVQEASFFKFLQLFRRMCEWFIRWLQSYVQLKCCFDHERAEVVGLYLRGSASRAKIMAFIGFQQFRWGNNCHKLPSGRIQSETSPQARRATSCWTTSCMDEDWSFLSCRVKIPASEKQKTLESQHLWGNTGYFPPYPSPKLKPTS